MTVRHLLALLLLAGSALLAASPQTIRAGESPADALEVPPLPISNWTTQVPTGNTLQLQEDGGTLRADYLIHPDQTFLVGHIVYWRGIADLLLQKPLTIPEGSKLERLRFEASGILNEDQRGSRKIMLLPILRDRDGELFYYTPTPGQHLLAGGTGWSQWQTTSFYAGEAGAATQDIYYAEGKLTNTWPDGQLEFLGFRIETREPATSHTQSSAGVAAIKRPECTGTIRLSSIRLSPLSLPYADPFFFADSVLSKKGEYRISASVLNAFQGPSIREFSTPLSFDPADQNSTRQKLSFPLGPDDNYWVRHLITDASGAVVKSDQLRAQVQGNPDAPLPAPVAADTVPAVGNLRVNYDAPGRGVYERGAPLKVSVRVFPKGNSALQLSWQLTAGMSADVFASETIPADSQPGQPYRDLSLTLPAQKDRDAYRLRLTLRSGDKVLDELTYLLGYQTDTALRHDRAGALTDRKAIHSRSYFRTTYLPPKGEGSKESTEQQEEDAFREYCANAGRIGRALTYMIDLKDFEFLPGVYDFALLDRILDIAADSGCRVNIRLAHADKNGKNFYHWPKYFRQISYDGTEAPGHGHYGAYSVTDPRVVKLWLDSYRALYNRYQQHTAFEGYYVMQPGGEWTVVDQPWAGVCTGYDPAASDAFRTWLQKNQKLSLDDLNRRWGTQLRSWSEVTPPQPDFRSGSQPDLRVNWLDFCAFKSDLGSGVWFPQAVRFIRSFDQRNLITIYGSPANSRNLYGLLDYGHNGGNHFGDHLGEYVRDWEKGGIGWITEPHHPHRWAAYGDPTGRGWVLDWSVWIMLGQAAGGGANLHAYYIANPTLNLSAHYGGAFALDRMELFRPVLEELSSLHLEEPTRQVATLTDNLTLYAKHRTTFNARLADLRRWFDLLKNDSVFYEEYTPENAANYKLLIPNALDEVMGAASIKTLTEGVRNGAKAVVCANTGKFAPELDAKPFALLRAFGITPPQQAYRLSGTGDAVNAVAVHAANAPALIPADGKLSFFTLARLSEDLKSDDIKNNFWRYPYRWIPQTDYFGIYPGVPAADGTVLARFPDGGAALSLHKFGKGEVLVFWGTPDMSSGRLNGFMAAVAKWAGIENPRAGSPIPCTLEGRSDLLGRRYALLYQSTPGEYRQKLLSIPDGKYFLDDMVSGQRYGIYEGKEMREAGLPLQFIDGYSPLKIIRMLPLKQVQAEWLNKYRVPE